MGQFDIAPKDNNEEEKNTKEVNSSDLQYIVDMIKNGTIDVSEIKFLVDSKLPKKEIFENFDEIPLNINYNKNQKEMIAAGSYDWVQTAVEQGVFSTWGNGKQIENISAKIFNFEEKIDNDEAIRRMKIEGYRPANFAELLALGAAYPKLQEKFKIVALGSSWSRGSDDNHTLKYSPSLESRYKIDQDRNKTNVLGRELTLEKTDDFWNVHPEDISPLLYLGGDTKRCAVAVKIIE